MLLWATKYTGPKLMHVLCLAVGALGLATVPLAPDKYHLLISMAAVGIAWASILSMPYAMLAPVVAEGKIGVMMGMFNLFIVLPQIAASSLLGWILKTFSAQRTHECPRPGRREHGPGRPADAVGGDLQENRRGICCAWHGRHALNQRWIHNATGAGQRLVSDLPQQLIAVLFRHHAMVDAPFEAVQVKHRQRAAVWDSVTPEIFTGIKPSAFFKLTCR